MVVAGMDRLALAPSTHYSRTLGINGCPSGLRDLVADLIDGRVAHQSSDFKIFEITTSPPDYTRIAACDARTRRQSCFVVDVFAREAHDGKVGWDRWDALGVPRLLDTVLHGDGRWQLYNCEVAVWPWRRSDLYAGIYPPDA
jgi:hypothetical protein